MELGYIMPTAGLAGALSIVGHVHALREPICDWVPALLPNLHIRLNGRSRYHLGGRWRDVPPVTLIGATSSAFQMDMSADFEMVCVGFLPAGWLRFVDFPCIDLANDMIDAAAVWPVSAVDRLWSRLAGTRDLNQRREWIETFLVEGAKPVADGDPRRIAAISDWLEQPGSLSIDGLSQRIDLCHRQITRLTLATFGASPKTLAMKYRALRAAGALTVRGRDALSDAMEDYTDQSHLIRDFHRFVGWTPGQFLTDRQPLARVTMLGRWEAGARSQLVLCS